MAEQGFSRVAVVGSGAGPRRHLLSRQAVIAGLSNGVVTVRTRVQGREAGHGESVPAAPTRTALATAPGATAILEAVLELAATLTGTRPDANTPLAAAGLDSIGALELRDGLSTRFGVALAATAGFDHPTPAALAVHVAGLVAQGVEGGEGGVGRGEGRAGGTVPAHAPNPAGSPLDPSAVARDVAELVQGMPLVFLVVL